MNNDKLMEQALGAYFDSLLTEATPEAVGLSVAAPAAEVLKLSHDTVEKNQAPQSVAEESFSAFEDAVRQERELDQQRYASGSPAPAKPKAKPLERLLEEAQQRISAPVAEPLPEMLPVGDIPEQAPELSLELQPETALETSAAEPLEPDPWENLITDDEFQVLFFELAGVTFGVPLTHLGGIHRLSEVSPLFGKPVWFAGIMLERDEKLSVVDTAKWVMPGQPFDPDYKYMVMLGDSAWGLSCEKLIGTELLNRSDVKWRTAAGSRPWLAGMVKKKMCALLHVDELESLLEKGVDIDGH